MQFPITLPTHDGRGVRVYFNGRGDIRIGKVVLLLDSFVMQGGVVAYEASSVKKKPAASSARMLPSTPSSADQSSDLQIR